MSDIIYKIPKTTIKKVREVFIWTKENSYDTHVEYLNCNESIARQKSNMPFDRALKLINKRALPFFCLIHRRMFMGSSNSHEYMEVVIRSLDFQGIEYFVYSFLKESKIKDLIKKFKLEKETFNGC